MKKIMLVICMLSAASLCRAQAPPSLGSAASFSALAGGPADGAVTCTTSTLTGDVGVVSPGRGELGEPAPGVGLLPAPGVEGGVGADPPP